MAKLRARFGARGDLALNVKAEELEGFGFSDKTTEKFTAYRRNTNPSDLALDLDKHGLRFVLITDDEYPPLLKQIADPPGALFIRGSDLKPGQDCVALVGTRNCTPYGRTVAAALARELAAASFSIISGLALGIDAVAHLAALEVGGVCGAVLGGGLDDASLYPRANFHLAMKILDHGGTLISEYPPRTESFKHHFPLRNRIISGLCRATVVVEAAEGSGSLITAHQALEQNREVFAVPGPITSPQSQGANKLIKLGAAPVLASGDIIQALRGEASEPPPPETFEVTDQEREVLDLLACPLHVDDLARALEGDFSSVSSVLLGLEMRGLIVSEGGKVFSRSPRWNPTAG
jgi:DNA processing protein